MTLADSRSALDERHEAYGQDVVTFTAAQTTEERNRAFAVIVAAHRDALLRFCSLKLNGDEDAAEDAVAETFALAWVGLRDLRKPRTVRKWLFTVANRRCLRILRLRSREIREVPEAVLDKASRRADAGDQDREGSLAWLDLLVAMLPPAQQRFHDLCFRQGFRGVRLAAALGEAPDDRAKVDKRVHRHVTWLQAALEAEIVVREAQYGLPCRVLTGMLEAAGHVVRPSEVMPVALGRKVIDHIGKCRKCGDDLKRGRVRYSPFVLLPILAAWGLIERPGSGVRPASFAVAEAGEVHFEERPPRPDRATRGKRRRTLVRSVAVGLFAIIVLILVLTVRTENSGGDSGFSVFQRPDPAAPGQSATAPDGTNRPGSPGARRDGGDGGRGDGEVVTPDPSFPGANAAEPAPGGPAAPLPPPGVLAVAPTSVNLPLYATTATVTVSAGSAMSWTASATDPAVSVTPAAGDVEAGRTRPIKLTVNRSAMAKPGTGLVVTSSTGQRVTVPVHWPTPGKVGVTTPRIDLGAQGAAATFSVTAANGNLNWSTGSPHPAVTVSPAGGTLTAGKGALVTVRLARPISTGGDVPLRVTTPDAQQVTVLVHWLATPGTLRTSTNAVHIGASDSTARFTVGVSSGTNTWTATLSAPGCTAPTCRLAISRTSGSGTAEITVTLWPHPSSADPAAHARGRITLTTPDGQRLTVDVTWDPYEPG